MSQSLDPTTVADLAYFRHAMAESLAWLEEAAITLEFLTAEVPEARVALATVPTTRGCLEAIRAPLGPLLAGLPADEPEAASEARPADVANLEPLSAEDESRLLVLTHSLFIALAQRA
ncbi:MAG: hypothetical protein M5U01_09470 [Ardenticatenaceae bacterium]|nr:hypothetical protein [Ardenticatenaceae bacterium]